MKSNASPAAPTPKKLAARHTLRARDIAGKWNGYWSPAQWLALLAEWDYRCAYCGKQLDPDTLTPDHWAPLARSGKNSIDNIMPTCLNCNVQKGIRTEAEYRALITQRNKVMKPNSRLNDALTDVLMPRNVKATIRARLDEVLNTITRAHGHPEQYAIEREALGKLALISELLHGDADRLPHAVHAKLLQEDLKTAERMEQAIRHALLLLELDRLNQKENSSDANGQL